MMFRTWTSASRPFEGKSVVTRILEYIHVEILITPTLEYWHVVKEYLAIFMFAACISDN